MNGYTRSQLIGQPIDILNPNPFGSSKRDEYVEILVKWALRYETPHRRKNGTEFLIEVSTSLISPGGRDVLLGSTVTLQNAAGGRKPAQYQAQMAGIF